jgi:hypothetical protein
MVFVDAGTADENGVLLAGDTVKWRSVAGGTESSAFEHFSSFFPRDIDLEIVSFLLISAYSM